MDQAYAQTCIERYVRYIIAFAAKMQIQSGCEATIRWLEQANQGHVNEIRRALLATNLTHQRHPLVMTKDSTFRETELRLMAFMLEDLVEAAMVEAPEEATVD